MALAVLTWRVRAALVVVAVGLALLFGVAAWIDPYDGSGRPRQLGTHRQLGLPPCNFYRLTGHPCPSCGMTTSFALLVRGDVGNSLRANAVGTLLALVLAAAVPWSLYSAARGRWAWVRSLEPVLLRLVIAFVALSLARWGVVLGMGWWAWD
jgi:hypothetical protein